MLFVEAMKIHTHLISLLNLVFKAIDNYDVSFPLFGWHTSQLIGQLFSIIKAGEFNHVGITDLDLDWNRPADSFEHTPELGTVCANVGFPIALFLSDGVDIALTT